MPIASPLNPTNVFVKVDIMATLIDPVPRFPSVIALSVDLMLFALKVLPLLDVFVLQDIMGTHTLDVKVRKMFCPADDDAVDDVTCDSSHPLLSVFYPFPFDVSASLASVVLRHLLITFFRSLSFVQR